MERYFEVMQRSGARSVALINKSDLHSDEANQAAEAALRALSPEVEVVVTSAIDGSGVDVIRHYLKPGVTIALIGSSGVGKSSLINQLIGQDWLLTSDVNAVTGKGTHTTAARELLCLKRGGMLIDNPGIREVHMWTDAKTLKASFADFDATAAQCKFNDCKHGSDKGCAVQSAITEGSLSRERFINYLKLDFELECLSQRKKKHEVTIGRRNRRELKSKGEKYSKKRV
jgi:ribosome biogenesis GTPase